jgi:hypothetical protein
MSETHRAEIRQVLQRTLPRAYLQCAITQHVAGREFACWWMLLYAFEGEAE